MKKVFCFKILVALISCLFCAIFLSACFGNNSEEPDKGSDNEVTEQEDTRSFKFAEHVGTISNPGIGYTSTDWFHTKVGETAVRNKQGDLVLFFINIGAFSAGANSDGVDYDLDEQFFAALRATFENCKNNGSTVAVRFRYDENGKENPEPNSFEQVLKHISQIKESGILEDYNDILMFVECGFVGKWGEQHGGKYTSVEYKTRLLQAMLDCVPSPIPVTVRTPDIFAKYVGIERNELAGYVAEEGSDASRVGLYNDGYMGSDSDLGTYANRDIETQWLGNQTVNSYFGGEFSGNIDFAKKYDAYLPENCIPEMYKTHLSYINGNIFQLYKDYTFDKIYDVEGFDNSAYYGQTVFQFIRDHLGYRFVLQKSEFPKSVAQGADIKFSFTVTNNGFANPVKKQKCEIILEKDGNFTTTEVELDPTKWYSGDIVTSQLNLKLPALLEPGKWNVYFKSSIGVDGFSQYGFRSVRFASKNVWHEAFGANYLGYVEIIPSGVVGDNTFGETGKEMKCACLFNLGGKVIPDGQISEDEWNEQDIIAESGQYKLYAKADEENLYVMADMPHNSKSPVFNFHAKAENGKTFWIYQQENGFIYFNHDSETGHEGMVMKYSDSLFEFKIPFYMLDLKNGFSLSEISVNVQDSADGWKSTGSLKTTKSYKVNSDFILYNAYEQLTIEKGCGYEFELKAETDIAEVIWYVDGVEKQIGKSVYFKLEYIQNNCVVSAKIVSAKGTVKEKAVAEIRCV